MRGMLSTKRQFEHYENMLVGWSDLPLHRNVTLDVGERRQIKVIFRGNGYNAREKIKRDSQPTGKI